MEAARQAAIDTARAKPRPHYSDSVVRPAHRFAEALCKAGPTIA
jgi:hypothetical protein